METHHLEHHSHHEHCGHGHKHGFIKRKLESAEQSLAQKDKKTFTRRFAAAALRGSSLLMCPGDDILTVGAGVVESIIGDVGQDHKQHTEATAILPGQTRFDFGRNVVYLRKPAVDTVAPPRPASAAAKPASSARERLSTTLETIKKRTKLALLGGLGLAMAAGLLGPAAQQEATEEAPRTPPASAPEVPQDPPEITEYAEVAPGDSQWSIAAQRTSSIAPGSILAVTNAVHKLTVHYNESAHPNPHLIYAGEQLRTPSSSAIQRIHQATTMPHQDPELATAITQLTHLAEHQAEESRTVTIRIDGLLK
ncbi:MAG TPA: hypothetical protein VFZ48_02690 [Candidatus Saccharimonadales bacterium]